MMILGLDPGTEKTGWALYNPIQNTVRGAGVWDNAWILNELETPTSTFNNIHFDIVGCEWIEAMGMAVGKSTFETVFWIGQFHHAKNHSRVTRKQVKINMCNSMRAKDANIRQSVIDRFEATGGGKNPTIGIKSNPGPLFGVSSHSWSALAVAITLADRLADSKLLEAIEDAAKQKKKIEGGD